MSCELLSVAAWKLRMAWHEAVPNGTAPSKWTAVIPYVSIEGKDSHSVLFLRATVRMAAECCARILWQRGKHNEIKKFIG